MGESLLIASIPFLTEIVLGIVFALTAWVAKHVNDFLDSKRGNEASAWERSVVFLADHLTNLAVKYAEKELQGADGREKRDYALTKAREFLANHGIYHLTDDEILAGIEQGWENLQQRRSKGKEAGSQSTSELLERLDKAESTITPHADSIRVKVHKQDN